MPNSEVGPEPPLDVQELARWLEPSFDEVRIVERKGAFKVELHDVPIRGFTFRIDDLDLSQLEPGLELQLCFECENKKDERAIAFRHEKTVIGYVPREANRAFGHLMLRGARMRAFLSYCDQPEGSWMAKAMISIVPPPADAVEREHQHLGAAMIYDGPLSGHIPVVTDEELEAEFAYWEGELLKTGKYCCGGLDQIELILEIGRGLWGEGGSRRRNRSGDLWKE